ncbi:hypothetical protein TEA_020059 [Camellia sinensis var. sinensis]|uniref:GRF-type domain-containing protein n=1 Tax=Camellia sinensis var. sinensis TaxID=542762 RepID=A0A4S4DX78_CAMSN|nr:hypothetical protein TEA_020059 [Camellia sinensis var. sinensis]
MASSSIDNTNLRLKPRFCNCGRIASVRIVRTNANGNKGRVYFVCPRKYDSNDHCNYFRWFADDDDDDDDITSSSRANAGHLEGNDLRTRLDDPKNSHLRELEGANERLTLYRADLLVFESLREAINGCDGVFHIASPVTNDPEEMVEPAVNETKNVIIAAAKAKVRRMVFTSSIGAVTIDPNRGPEPKLE